MYVRGPMVVRAVVLAVVFVSSLGVVVSAPEAAAGPFERSQRQYARVKTAFETHLASLETAFTKSGAAWPPRGIYIRAFKTEGMLELWAEKVRGPERVLVRNFPICASSGVLGPKARSGDGQVPEGFYTVDRFNPRSSYHVSLGLDYPNAVDRVRAGDGPPGGDIFIHGSCVTIGCLPLEDTPMEALYVVAVLARDRGQKVIPVHVFPFRFGTPEAARLTAEAEPSLVTFWETISPGFVTFEKTRVPPKVRATKKGYSFD